MLSNPQTRRDFLKLSYLSGVLLGCCALLFMVPSLSAPVLISIVVTMLLQPFVAALERRGLSRLLALGIVFTVLIAISTLITIWVVRSGEIQWQNFKDHAPDYFFSVIHKLREYEDQVKAAYPILKTVNFTDSVLDWGEQTGKWFVVNGASIAGDVLTCFFLVPIITFVLLNEGREIRRGLFHFVPNRFFEFIFLVANKISTGVSDYVRAKLFEAVLVGVLTGVGLKLIGFPYAVVLAALAGITNILPYIGPLLGAVPPLLIAMIEPGLAHFLVPLLIVFALVNLIDTVLIFPVVVAKLVNLHPLVLIVVVMIGQRYYGLVGMLISIPIATTLKVILTEIYSAVHAHEPRKRATAHP